MARSIEAEVDLIVQKDPRYSSDAYHFVISALCFAACREPSNHVSAKHLLDGIKSIGAQRYGTGAPAIFREWGINSSRDFGLIVFKMVEQKLLVKSVTDSLDDFENGLDFATGFPEPFYENRVFLGICLATVGLIAWLLITKH